MIIRKAYKVDLQSIMKMYESCVSGMIQNNIDQWDENYPNSKTITSDLDSETYYVAEIAGEIAGWWP